MRHFLTAVFFVLAMTACSPDKEVTRNELFEVTYVHPKATSRFFAVDLKNVETGEISLAVFVTRRCSDEGRAQTKASTRWELPVTTATYHSGRVKRTLHAHSLCQTESLPPLAQAKRYQSM